MYITEEKELFIREVRRLLDDYERSPLRKKPDIMEDVLVIVYALNVRERQSS